MRKALTAFIGLSVGTVLAAPLPEYKITLKDHLFTPANMHIPANRKVKITFINKDDTAEEIDSFDLNREKVVFAHSQVSIFVGPLKPGEYRYFGEYHPDSAIGKVIVENPINADQ